MLSVVMSYFVVLSVVAP